MELTNFDQTNGISIIIQEISSYVVKKYDLYKYIDCNDDETLDKIDCNDMINLKITYDENFYPIEIVKDDENFYTLENEYEKLYLGINFK